MKVSMLYENLLWIGARQKKKKSSSTQFSYWSLWPSASPSGSGYILPEVLSLARPSGSHAFWWGAGGVGGSGGENWTEIAGTRLATVGTGQTQ